MKIFIGTYRGDKKLVLRCLRGFYDHVFGITNMIFVDDSGDKEFRKWLNRYGNVLPVGVEGKEDGKHQGFARAMQTACTIMGDFDDPAVCWWEEDFVAVADINLDEYAKNLAHKLCQITFQRQPVYEKEHALGVVGAMEARTGCQVTRGPAEGGMDLLWQQGQFSTNPGVWGPNAWKHGWPGGAGSEDRKTQFLVEDEQFFGITPEVLVHHDGERLGTGY